MKFRSVFIAVFIGTALIVAALILQKARPSSSLGQPSPQFVRAEGKCASCHLRETSAIVHQFQMSKHARVGITCFDCHRPLKGQEKEEHRGFVITTEPTSLNCKQCHSTEYEQFARSRHSLPAYAAVLGTKGMTPEMIAFGEKYHKGAVNRPPNKLARLEGAGVIEKGCMACHDIGQPNPDGSIGSCTQCHSRHSTSVALAREPQTCGQCHMGPDHSQIEIYNESKHGALFNAQRNLMNMSAPPKKLSARDMPVPTCSTCHMSGLEGLKVTHDTTERLSYWLFASISKKRPNYQQGRTQMKEVCRKCHAAKGVDTFFKEAEVVLVATNEKVQRAQALMDGLYRDKLLTPQPFDESIEFLYFDYWHYFGRTAKHGAFMGGADFVQWHGNYELLLKFVEIQEMAKEIREAHAKK